MMRIFAMAVLMTWCALAAAQVPGQSATPELDQRLKLLETELRCLVCQNQTLAESPAGLADDLRREVRALAVAGKSNEEIKDFLQQRYGDFILYKPRMKQNTMLLWIGPFALLLLGGLVFVFLVRSRAAPATGPDRPKAADDAARKLLDDDEKDGPR